MIKSSKLHILIDDKRNRYIIICPDKETIHALIDLIALSNEALEDCEEDA